ncbi:ribonuclease HII [Lysinibacillus sphaericus]|uniref:ribonuclease HII n=1 Tax=Lysinibacillus sphaericus TaxID=1421 RepID=UPI0018CF24F0|nr:ribonuclease HII [Lysinibacillus sphaericus]MBG9455158.1 ribonuclease HII [Lysinibacillus sphaericus]MBG9478702.1 ribonuclease HII [Lysinibacillus sphaericus]MBG9592429.1 ribonuclease HII [Lysinibacillus sphaericus]
MKTIKEITAALKEAEEWQDWMTGVETDGRAGVQKAWLSWKKRQDKKQQLLQEHQAKVDFDQSYGGDDAFIAGVDEAGRGPLAGPVVTAAVILPANCEALVGLNDSKQLSKDKRSTYAGLIKEHALSYFIHFQSAQQIDELNIYEATKQSMKTSVESLSIKPNYVLVDAMTLPISIPQDSIIKGDAKSLAIAAASILAKTARDDYMDQLDEEFPMYGFAQHAGYGTTQHLIALEEYGPTIHHRKSFEPIKSML